MKPPGFWNNSATTPGWQARLLGPAAALFSLAAKARGAREPVFRARVPVICIGNLSLGGAGKTPTAIALAQRLMERGVEPHFVSRGYGGRFAGPVQVDVQKHQAADVGDEPLLLAAFAPTWVARDRVSGVECAQDAGARVIILDDGFQNPTVAKDFSIVVVDAGVGFGNGRVFPAGPLREPVASGLARADVLLCIGEPGPGRANDWQGFNIPQCHGTLEPLQTGMQWAGLKVLAFAGIGRPEKFFMTLRELGVNLVRSQALDDHQPISLAMAKRLQQEADRLGAQLVTTEKDAVRLPPEYRSQVLSLVVRLQIEDWGPIDTALAHLNLEA